MTCLYCDKKLSYFRMLCGARYCGEEHRTKDVEKMNELAIQRLRNAQGFERVTQPETNSI